MTCPYCEREMEKGYIPTGNQTAQWIPENASASLLSFMPAEGSVKLNSTFRAMKFGGFATEAYYCRQCKTAIIKR